MKAARALFILAQLSVLAASVSAASSARAENYPARPVRMIVPYQAGGGGLDAMVRVLAQRLSEQTGAKFFVENLPGAGGTIGTGIAGHAAADGHTILFINQDFVVQPLVKAKVPYDPFKSFAPVTMVAVGTEAVVISPSLPVKNMRGLIDLLKANPGKYSYATPGYGTSPHLASERLFKLSHGLDVVHVPFQGGAPAVAATVSPKKRRNGAGRIRGVSADTGDTPPDTADGLQKPRQHLDFQGRIGTGRIRGRIS